MISYILAIIAGGLLLAADQYTKYLVANNFVLGGDAKTLIPGLVDMIFVKNDGGAWGLLGGRTWLLLSLTIIIMLVCVALLLKVGVKNKLMFWSIVLILAGGLGNMIDRIVRGGYVVDFLHFTFWKSFPVFNVADCGIVIGAALLLLYFLFGMLKESREKKKAAESVITETTQNNGNNK